MCSPGRTCDPVPFANFDSNPHGDTWRRGDAIRVIERNISDHFGTFLEIVYLVYYSQPAVHRRNGWVGRPPQPEGFDLSPFDESILETVRKREPFWRKVDG